LEIIATMDENLYKGLVYEEKGGQWIKRRLVINFDGSLAFYKSDTSKRPLQTFRLTKSTVVHTIEKNPTFQTKGRLHFIEVKDSFRLILSGETKEQTNQLFNSVRAIVLKKNVKQSWWHSKVLPMMKDGPSSWMLELDYDAIHADYLKDHPNAVAITEALESNPTGAVKSESTFQDAKEMFKEAAVLQERKLEANPFSDKYKGPKKFDKSADDYGKPKEGSLTALRGQKAHKWVDENIEKLVTVIQKHGKFDETRHAIAITFADLFNAYSDVSDTLVGILQRAKKRRRIHFPGDMLFQGASDTIVISVVDDSVDSHFAKLEKLSGKGTAMTTKVPTMISRSTRWN